MSGQESEKFPKINIFVSIFLLLVTGGFYSFYWIVGRGGFLYKMQNKNIKAIVLGYRMYLFLGALFIFIAISGLFKSNPLIAVALNLLILISMYVMTAVTAYDVAKFFRQKASEWNFEKSTFCSPLTAFGLTFLALSSSVYLQHHCNKLYRSPPPA